VGQNVRLNESNLDGTERVYLALGLI